MINRENEEKYINALSSSELQLIGCKAGEFCLKVPFHATKRQMKWSEIEQNTNETSSQL